jgi:hypothetical protein
MTVSFDLDGLRLRYNCVNYFETGLWDPRTNTSSKQALGCNFEKVFCIEIFEEWVKLGKDIFKAEILTGRYNLYLDDSVNMKKYLVGDAFNEKTMFFLDAHVDNASISNYKYKCPLIDELTAIGTLARKDNIILIDDIRIIRNAFPWGEQSFGNIDFLQKIKDIILSINNNYKFTFLDGHVKDDVLCAYIE